MRKMLSKCCLGLLVCVATFFCATIGSASAFTWKDSKTITNVQDLTTSTVCEGVTYTSCKVSSYYDGVVVSKNGLYSGLYDYNTDILEADLKGGNVQVVQYSSVSSTDKWKMTRPTLLAKEYEETHPGYKVVGAINGDFFDISNTGAPIGSVVQDGRVFQAPSWGTPTGGAIGMKADGTIVTGRPTYTSKETLKVYNTAGEIVSTTPIASTNSISASGISILTSIKDVTDDALKGKFVYEVKFTNQKKDVNKDSYFIEGPVTKVGYDRGVFSGASYIVSSTDLGLTVGTNIISSFDYTGEWANVQSAFGYFCQLLKDGKPMYQASKTTPSIADTVGDFCYSYMNVVKNRTAFGFKADGSLVLMTTDKSDYGSSYYELGEYLRCCGCVSGYIMDGGGSSLLAMREENGKFVVKNNPSDTGGERSDGNAVLLVVKDPGFDISVTDTNYYSATVNLNTHKSIFSDSVKNVKVQVNGVSQEFVNNISAFTNLLPNTEYLANVTYDIVENGKTTAGSFNTHFKTSEFVQPVNAISIIKKSKTSLTFGVKDEYKDIVKNVVLDVSGITYTMGDNDSYEVTPLIEDTSYDVNITYDYNDPVSKQTYACKMDAQKVKTLSFDLPTIDTFELKDKTDTTATFRYKLIDADKAITKVYILYNGEKVLLDSAETYARYTIEGLTVGSIEYKFQLVIEYQIDGETIEVKSNEVTIEKDADPVTPPSDDTTEKKGCKKSLNLLYMMSLLSLVVILLKKKNN